MHQVNATVRAALLLLGLLLAAVVAAAPAAAQNVLLSGMIPNGMGPAGGGMAFAAVNPATGFVTWDLDFDTTLGTPSEVAIVCPSGGVQMLLPIGARFASPIVGGDTLAPAQVTDLVAGRCTARIRTPSGVYAAPLAPNGVMGASPVAAGAAVQTTGSAEFTATLDPATRRLTWHLQHAGLSGPVTGATLTMGATGATRLTLPAGASPTSGMANLTPAQATEFAAGQWSLTLATQRYPMGELRGPVVGVNIFAATLTAASGGDAPQGYAFGILFPTTSTLRIDADYALPASAGNTTARASTGTGTPTATQGKAVAATVEGAEGSLTLTAAEVQALYGNQLRFAIFSQIALATILQLQLRGVFYYF